MTIEQVSAEWFRAYYYWHEAQAAKGSQSAVKFRAERLADFKNGYTAGLREAARMADEAAVASQIKEAGK